MSDELQDYDLKSAGDETTGAISEGGSPRWPWIVGVLVVILIVVAVIWFRRDGAEPTMEPQATPSPVVAEPPVEEGAESRLDLGEIPELVDSDPWLRGIVAQVSSHPQLAEWLVTEELIRGFVVVVDNVAEGTSPAQHLEIAAPAGQFSVRETGGESVIDPSSYRRFDLLTEVVDSLDPAGTAELYAAIRPLLEQAYGDLGYPGEDFEPTLERAIRRVLAVPVIDRPVEVEQQVTAYEFRDPALEDLSPAAKLFLRLGPDNLQRMQAKLRELGRAIGLEV